jgi:hypothetical protein
VKIYKQIKWLIHISHSGFHFINSNENVQFVLYCWKFDGIIIVYWFADVSAIRRLLTWDMSVQFVCQYSARIRRSVQPVGRSYLHLSVLPSQELFFKTSDDSKFVCRSCFSAQVAQFRFENVHGLVLFTFLSIWLPEHDQHQMCQVCTLEERNNQMLTKFTANFAFGHVRCYFLCSFCLFLFIGHIRFWKVSRSILWQQISL